jgi:hypothetical protein
MYSYPRGFSRNHKGFAGAAVSSAQIDGNTDPVPHRNTSRELNIPVGETRIDGKGFFCPPEQDLDTFPCDALNFRTS